MNAVMKGGNDDDDDLRAIHRHLKSALSVTRQLSFAAVDEDGGNRATRELRSASADKPARPPDDLSVLIRHDAGLEPEFLHQHFLDVRERLGLLDGGHGLGRETAGRVEDLRGRSAEENRWGLVDQIDENVPRDLAQEQSGDEFLEDLGARVARLSVESVVELG